METSHEHGSAPNRSPYLSPAERKAAAGLGLALVGIAALVFFLPRKLTTVIDGCTPTSSITCTALVDSDNNSFAGIVVVVGGAAVLIAILGIRFSNVKVAGIELQGDFDDKTAGLPIVPSPSAGVSAVAAVTATNEGADQSDVGTVLAGFRQETYEGHHNIFLTHLLGKPTQPRQKYRVALFLVGHKRPMNRNEIKGRRCSSVAVGRRRRSTRTGAPMDGSVS